MASTAITARDIGLAAEAFNRISGLSPLARRVGLELVSHANKKTGTAWPSEARLAECLGCTDRAIRKAKAQLAGAGLISWRQRGRHKQRTPLYIIAWTRLRAIAQGIKERVAKATAPFRRKASGQEFSTALTRASAPPDKGKIALGRNTRSSYPSHINLKGLGKVGGGTFERPPPDAVSVAEIEKRASARLWAALTALPEQAYNAIV